MRQLYDRGLMAGKRQGEFRGYLWLNLEWNTIYSLSRLGLARDNRGPIMQAVESISLNLPSVLHLEMS